MKQPLKVELIMEARASFEHLLARLQALDVETASIKPAHHVTDVSNDPSDTTCTLKPVEADAFKLYIASANAMLKAGEALIDRRSEISARTRGARMADVVGQTKEACRTAYRAALLLTDW